MAKRFRTVLGLGKEEKKLFFMVFLLLIRIRYRMIFHSFPRVLSWIRKISPRIGEERLYDPEKICWMIDSTGIAMRRVYRCLARALAGFILCRRFGWEVTLKIGMRRSATDSKMEAHAWLEREGEILLGNREGLGEYAVFETFEGKYL